MQSKFFLETTETIQIIHRAVDASWADSAQAISCLRLQGKYVVATVFDKSLQKFVWLKSVEILQENHVFSKEEIKALFPASASQNINLFAGSAKTVLVPEAIYDASAKYDFFKLNHTLAANERIESNFSKKLGANLLFAAENILQQNLSVILPKKFIHQDVAWLEVLSLQHKNDEDTFVHINIESDTITVAAFRDGGLLLYNAFPAETPEDKLYFTMFVSEQLRINPHKDFYFLSGNINRLDETYTLFSKYIKELKFQPRPENFRYSLPLHELPEHLYFKDFCTAICEL